MIEVDGLVKRYGRVSAVDGVSFRVEPGELLALLGPNGAGKSTTIRAITVLLRPSAGTVRVAGHDVLRESVAAKASLGYVPDRPYLYGKLTPRELLRFIARVHGVQDAALRISQWLELFSLTDFGNELIEVLSHGMRQKLAFTAAMLHRPQVLVVDEPMVGLDPRAARQVRQLLREYAAKGNTVLLTTHSLEVAEEVADRVIVLDRGRILAEGDLASLRERSGMVGAGLEEVFIRLLEQQDA